MILSPNKADAQNPAVTSLLQARCYWRGVCDLRRWVAYAGRYMNFKKGIAIFASIAIVAACAALLSIGTGPPPALKLSLLSITNATQKGSAIGVFQLDNDLKTRVVISSPLLEQNSGWHWTLLWHPYTERLDKNSSPIIFRPGRTIFQAWLPDRGGPYRLVFSAQPMVPWHNSLQRRFGSFLSDHNLMPDSAYKAHWRLQGDRVLISAPFRVSKGGPLSREDLPIVYLSPPN